jgi:hypothetical protein
MAFVGTAATVLSTAAGMAEQQQTSAANAAMSNYQAELASNQEQVAQQEAQDSLEQGQANAQQQRLKAASLVGALRANSAANGVTLDSGSSLDAQSDAAEQGELDAESAVNASQQQAYGQQAQAMDYAAQSGLDSAKAGFTQQAGNLALAGNLLSGGANAIDSINWESLYGN